MLDEEIQRLEAQGAAEESERRLTTERGAKVEHDAELNRCSGDSVHWFNKWVWMYDPRLVGIPDPADRSKLQTGYAKVTLWPKQVEYVGFLERLMAGQKEGLTEKSRDAGATYIAAGFALHKWLFAPGFKATFGSRDADLVDTIGDPDSIFEKIRIILRRLPSWMLPVGFDWRKHSNEMKLINPATGATLTGEGGDEMGRGGRSTIYFLDEAAFVARFDRVMRAISGSCDCIQYISSVNGPNHFQRKRLSLPPAQVFVFDVLDDPRKTSAWVAAKKKSIGETAYASEFGRDYSASVEGICIPASWVQAATRLYKLSIYQKAKKPKYGITGGDVGGGKAMSVCIHRFGHWVSSPASRGDPDTTDTAYWMLDQCEEAGTSALCFDAPGIGKGVLSTLMKSDRLPKLQRVAVNTGEPADENRVWPDERTSDEMFGNQKAEIWSLAREALWRTYQYMLWLESGGKQGEQFPIDELVGLPSETEEDLILIAQLSVVRRFKNDKGKIVIETKKQLQDRGIPSPDYADAFVLTYVDPPDDATPAVVLEPQFGRRDNPFVIGSPRR